VRLAAVSLGRGAGWGGTTSFMNARRAAR
jgi:hypothetical protein